MSERAKALAEKFEQANAGAIALVERLSEADWQKGTGEGWTVAATAHHVAIVHEGIIGFISTFANGVPRTVSGMDAVHEGNAKHAQEYATCSKAEVLEELRSKSAAAAAIVREFSDEQLDHSALAPHGAVATTQQLLEMVLIGHVVEHVDSITKATGG